MVQVHTVFRSASWQTFVDGLRQARVAGSRSGAVAEGRRVAAELRGRHIVHDIDGTVVERMDFSAGTAPASARPDPVDYLG